MYLALDITGQFRLSFQDSARFVETSKSGDPPLITSRTLTFK